jgi:hypothetical protein
LDELAAKGHAENKGVGMVDNGGEDETFCTVPIGGEIRACQLGDVDRS